MSISNYILSAISVMSQTVKLNVKCGFFFCAITLLGLIVVRREVTNMSLQ